MAQVYKINNKRYEFVEVDSSLTSAYTLSESDFNKWIKADTTDSSIDIQMPDGLSEGFRCIIENTGVFTVNYINGAGTSLATQQDNITEDQYRTVEIVFNNSQWRLQGYIGRNDISSLYDVNTTAQGVPNDGDVLQYDVNAGLWSAASQPPLFARSAETIDFILTEEDHGKIIPVDTSFAPVDVALNLGLSDGFKVKLINVGTGTMTITAAPTLNIASTIINTQYTFVDLFHSGLETYFGTINSVTLSGTALDYLKVNSTSTEANASGNEAIALGSLAIGNGVQSLAVGLNATCAGADSISIGTNAEAALSRSVSIGLDSRVDFNPEGVAIGDSASCTGFRSIALGAGAVVIPDNSIQLGQGTNNNVDTLQYRSRTIATPEGIKAFDIAGVPGGTATNGNLAVNTLANSFYFYSNNNWREITPTLGATNGAPGDAPTERTMRFDVSTNILYIYNGSSWVSTTLT